MLPVEGDAVMSQSTYFVQECPTCGRRVQIRVEYLGRQVVCNHCQGNFDACERTTREVDVEPVESPILRRANQLLETVEHRRTRPR